MPSLTFLGTGASYAVPAPGCDCSVCRRGFKPFAKWYRTRCSALIEHHGKSILIDVSPDFREQALRNQIRRIDAVLLTHAHMDSIGGIPDLRGYSHEKEKKIPVFANSNSLKSIRHRFSYAFSPRVKTSKPELELREFPERMQWNGLKIIPIRVLHPPIPTHAFRINDLAYVSDIKKMPAESRQKLHGIKTLVINGTSDIGYKGHQTIFESIELAKELKAKRVFFTHIGHRIERMKIRLPKGMRLAHDGLKIRF